MTRRQPELNVLLPDVASQPVPRRTVVKGLGLGAVLAGMPGFLAACGGDKGGKGGSGGGGDKVLNFYNWTAYIDESSEPQSQRTIPLFQTETGIKVNYRTYASNEELLTKLRAGDSGFDLVVPTDWLVSKLIKSGKLRKLDHKNIPNLENLAKKYTELEFDPGNEYSVCWANGNTGIGYNTTAVTEKVEDASIFGNSKYAGKMTLLDEMRSTVPLALVYLGYEHDEADPKKLDKAFDQLREWKKNCAVSSDYQDPLGAGDLVVSHAYSGDVFQQIDAGNKDLAYVIPKQGADQYIDCMCIPSDAPHAENAERFINYVYEPEVSKRLMEAITYRNGNEKAYALLDPEVRDNPVVFPPPDVEERLFFTDISEEAETEWKDRWDKFVAS